MAKGRNRRGFTLIEVVIVIAILGLLAGIGIPRYLDFTAKSRGTKIVTTLRTLDSAVSVYMAKTGIVPSIGADGSGSDVFTKEDPVNGKFLLLAEWPTPPKGAIDIVFPCDPEKTVTLADGDGFYIVDEDGRAKFFMAGTGNGVSGYTAEELATDGTARF